MIINLKTANMLSITLKRRPLLGRAGIEQLTNYDYPMSAFDVRRARRRFPVGANPTRQSLQPEAIGAAPRQSYGNLCR